MTPKGADTEDTATLTGVSDGPAGELYLHAFWPNGSTIVALPAHDEVVVGRGETCSARIDHKSVSRRHARIRCGPGVSVEDLGSHNGTRVDGVPLVAHASIPVRVGAVIEVGSVVLVLRHGAGDKRRGDPTAAMERVEQLVDLVAKSSMSLVLLGETGVGKTMLARRIHEASRRAESPFISVNFAAVPESLVESELFGHVRGAFTGASEAKVGLVESAHRGTIFLDEIGEVPLATQAKLLRVLESGEVVRLGTTKPVSVDVRYVSATNRDLKAAIARGAFRADLFYRLDGLSITVPPLRQRPEQIPALAAQFAADAARELERKATLAPDANDRLVAYPWPGNVRELRNVIKRSVLLTPREVVHATDLRFEDATALPAAPAPLARTAEDSERQRILDALDACAWNQSRAAKLLQMSRRTLVDRLGRYEINRPHAPRVKGG
jgi:two-component system response regulator AtoC